MCVDTDVQCCPMLSWVEKCEKVQRCWVHRLVKFLIWVHVTLLFALRTKLLDCYLFGKQLEFVGVKDENGKKALQL